tara:strand:- start:98 stop:271 length:174 start_codon:yes stop_codon:yes gene_type:complete
MDMLTVAFPVLKVNKNPFIRTLGSVLLGMKAGYNAILKYLTFLLKGTKCLIGKEVFH